jgi:tRNA(Ile)-lysidine synthase
LEERARELRYEFLNRTADLLEAHLIVLGHHRDDQAETVLLRLLRGTGIPGLAAMDESGPGRLVRPLLSLGHTAILDYLAAIGADFITDSSNLENGALRNRVRTDLLPHLERDYSPGIARRLAELASEMREARRFIEAEARRSLEQLLILHTAAGAAASCRMDTRGFSSISPVLARAIIREFIRQHIGDLRRIQRAHIDASYRLASGEDPSAQVLLPRGWRFRREYDTLMFEQLATQAVRAPSTTASGERRLVPGVNPLAPGGPILIVRQITAEESGFPTAPWHPPNRLEAYFDADTAIAPTARRFRVGDRIRPLGLEGTRKVHDVFVDYKVTRASRRLWPLVLFANEVIWIPGLVRSRVALVTPASKKVLHLRAASLPEGVKV